MTWAVDATVSGLNIHTVGIILMVVGIVGLILALSGRVGEASAVHRAAGAQTSSKTARHAKSNLT